MDRDVNTPERDPAEFLPLTHLTYQVLLALADADRHGYGILKEVFEATDGSTELETGTLYAAIKRLRDDDVIEPAEPTPGQDRRRRNYHLTAFGRRVLQAESMRLAHLVSTAVRKSVIPAL